MGYDWSICMKLFLTPHSDVESAERVLKNLSGTLLQSIGKTLADFEWKHSLSQQTWHVPCLLYLGRSNLRMKYPIHTLWWDVYVISWIQQWNLSQIPNQQRDVEFWLVLNQSSRLFRPSTKRQWMMNWRMASNWFNNFNRNWRYGQCRTFSQVNGTGPFTDWEPHRWCKY